MPVLLQSYFSLPGMLSLVPLSGFTTGQKLEVITQPGQLIIRLTTEE